MGPRERTHPSLHRRCAAIAVAAAICALPHAFATVLTFDVTPMPPDRGTEGALYQSGALAGYGSHVSGATQTVDETQ